MIQQINLLNPALLKQKSFVNVMNIALSSVVLLGFMLAYYAYIYQQSRLLSTQRNQITVELSSMQAQLTQLAALRRARVSNQVLHDKVVQLERQEVMQQKVLHLLDQSSAKDQKSYAAIMRAFARQSLKGLWLTGFSIESQANALSISGRSLLAEIVPEYIERLGDEPSLQGKSFATLSMFLTSEHAVSNSELASTVIAPESSKQSAGTTQPQQKKYIAFVLKSHNERSLENIKPSKTGGQP